MDGAVNVSRKAGISELAIGLTVVALGTSAPEFVVGIIGTISHNTELILGNIIGSNIANIFLVMGIAGVIRPIDIGSSTIRKEIPFYLLITLVLFGFLNETWMDSSVSFGLNRWEAITFLVLLVAFIRYTFSLRRDYTPDLVSSDVKALTPGWSAVYLLGGALTLGVGGELTVRGAVAMAESFGISEAFIGLTVIAVGTSLPELVTSVQAVRKVKFDIAVGNIIGSCVMNILFVLGLCGLLNHIPFVRFLNVDIGISIIGGLMLMMFMATGRRHRLDRWEAVLFLVSYVVYLVYLVWRK